MAKLSDPCVKVEHMAAVFDINTGFRSSAVATINAGLETITVEEGQKETTSEQ